MAVNQTRSMNADLVEGATDGKYVKRQTGPDRGGVADPLTKINRAQLQAGQNWGEGKEAALKVAPDGTVV